MTSLPLADRPERGRNAASFEWSAVRDCSFAVHLPWLDRLFGSRHLPAGGWPAA